MTKHNHHDAFHDDNFDEFSLRELLSPIRNIEAPDHLQAMCDEAIRESLSSTAVSKPDSSISRFSLPSSMLAVIAASVLLGVALGWTLRGSRTLDVVVVEQRDPLPRPSSTNLPTPGYHVMNKATSSVDYQEDMGEASFFTHEIYVCGVGRFQSSTEFQFAGISQ